MEEDLDLIDDINQLNNSKKEKDKENSIITFAKLNKYFLFPFLSPFFCMLSNYLFAYVLKSNVIKKIFFKFIFFQLSYVIGGLLYFISYYKQKKKRRNELNKENNTIKYIYNEQKIKIFTKKILLLLLLISLLIIGKSLILYLSVKNHNVFEIRLYYIFFIPLFSKYILKENIYKHQYLSLIISLFGIIFLIIPICLVFEKDDIIPNLLNIIRASFYSLALILIKYLYEKYYISPFISSLLFGIICILITCLIFTIYSYIEYHDLSYFNDCLDFSQSENKVKIIVYLILSFIFALFLQIFALLVIIYFSPVILIVTDIISPMLYWIVETIQDGYSMPHVIIIPIGYIITLFSSLIYNEIIILNFWDLNENTKKYVEQRQNIESMELVKCENNIKQDDLLSIDVESMNINEELNK